MQSQNRCRIVPVDLDGLEERRRRLQNGIEGKRKDENATSENHRVPQVPGRQYLLKYVSLSRLQHFLHTLTEDRLALSS